MTPSAPLAIRRLTLTRFRSYAALRLEVGRGPILLTGPNGAGKTNLLEAISLLVPGRGLRGARLTDLAARDAPGAGWGVAAEAEGRDGPVRVATGLEPGGPERRQIRLDGRPAAQADLARHLAAVWLTPAMDRLFLEGGAARRRFLDRLVFALDPAHAGRLTRAEHAQRERARLLEEGRFGEGTWLASLEATLAASAVAVAAARVELVRRLAPHAAALPPPFPRAALALTGEPEAWVADGPALAAEDRLRAALASGRRAEAAGTRPAPGPGRADLRVTHAERAMPAELCSTGEQKALLVALVLAHARLIAADQGGVPLLLLDEMAAHLDEGRRAALFRAILDLGAQAWLTGTDSALFRPFVELAGGAVESLSVAGGRIDPLRP